LMRKLSITTIASFAVNVILSLWLVNQYYYDAYFHSYVDATLGPVYPFIVLTAGLGGGSSLGYLLLRRRHAGDGTAKLEKARLFKSSGPVQSSGGTSSSSQGKMMPTGPPPGQVSRHTAYAVPPLPKSSSTSSSTRGSAPSSMSATAKTAIPPSPTSQRFEQFTQPSTSILNSTLRDQYRPEQAPRTSPLPPPPSAIGRGENTQPMNRVPPEPSRMSFPSQWKPEPSQSSERGPNSTVFPRPGQTDVRPAAESPGFGGPVGQVPKPPQASQTPFPVSKWVPPEQRAGGQWTDPVPKPGLATPQKWGPPPGQGAGPRPPQGVPPRPGSAPGPGPAGQRPPFPPGQGGPPRPLGYPNPSRPGQPGPVGVAPPFRPDQPRPSGPPPQGRPIQSPGGPLPQPWSPPKPAERGESGGTSQDRDLSGSPPARPSQFGPSEGSRPTDSKPVEQSPPGGEMDWDTALDTILKTLKKDRGVGERT
jgi:hypothetical protein